jgi:predicted  nucleic acid-binding Zn-ribbon protein
MTPTIVEIKLEDVLTKIDNRLERIEGELTDIKVSQAQIKGDLATFQAEVKGNLNTIKTELTLTREDVKDLKSSQRTQIWTLIGLITTVITAIVAAAVKLGFFSNP